MPNNMLGAASDAFWYGRGQHIASIWTTPESIRELSNLAFAAGARWAMRETTVLSPHIQKFIEMLILLGVFDAEAAAMADQAESGTASVTPEPRYCGLSALWRAV